MRICDSKRNSKQSKKKIDQKNSKLITNYEKRIDELQKQIVTQIVPTQRQISEPQDQDEEYDVFVSHAFEDKEDFSDEFVEELKKCGLTVWYDTDKLKWGDSMRAKIDRGLSKSRYGVVILSPNYIAEGKYWTKTELNGLFQVESINEKPFFRFGAI